MTQPSPKLFASYLVLLVTLLLSSALSTSCLNEHQQPVTWFIALRIRGPANPRKYVIMDSLNKVWRDTEETLLVKPNFDQISAKDDLVAAWNDE